jgi:hypothetical protein
MVPGTQICCAARHRSLRPCAGEKKLRTLLIRTREWGDACVRDALVRTSPGLREDVHAALAAVRAHSWQRLSRRASQLPCAT